MAKITESKRQLAWVFETLKATAKGVLTDLKKMGR